MYTFYSFVNVICLVFTFAFILLGLGYEKGKIRHTGYLKCANKITIHKSTVNKNDITRLMTFSLYEADLNIY